MTDFADWQDCNTAYLAAAVAWLRLRMELCAGMSLEGPLRGPSQRANAAAETAGAPFGNQSSSSVDARDTEAGVLQMRRRGEEIKADIAQAAARMAKAESQTQPSPALVMLAQRLGLSRFEREILLLCAAMEMSTDFAGLCANAQRDPSKAYPTFALALSLFDEAAWDALSPERPLRYWRLVEINQPAAQPLTTSALRADERIVNFIKGLNYLDDRLAPLLAHLQVPEYQASLPASQLDAVGKIVRQLERNIHSGRIPTFQLLGHDVASKHLVAWHAASVLGLRVYRLPSGSLPTQAAELETLARLWERESLLLPIALYIDTQESESGAPAESQLQNVNRFLARCNGVFFLDARDVAAASNRACFTLDIAKPTPAEQELAWSAALAGNAGASPAQLAGQFNLNLATIQQITYATLQLETATGKALHRQLWDACRANVRPRMDSLAQRIEPKATWDDIVLPHAEVQLLRQIADQVGHCHTVYDRWGFRQKMNRGLGVNALFAGESGTGKTMAAEVIANDLRLNLYRIDLSAVVSKYIGETEKNLRRLFDAAEDGGAILFFDEADALFGKRSEVKDSHDRYANIEVNYLLQRMESYRGLAIMATNMKSALDSAFLRRLRFIVSFRFPGIEERKTIWQKAFPEQTPKAGLELDRLARLNLAGGNIQTIALNATFLAARANSPVTMPHILEAARAEFRKLERPINETDFHWEAKASAAVA
jgi:ATP-dependent 26S proteasome regulatory subunit